MTRLMMYKCDHCHYINENKSEYINHLKEHIFQNRFTKLENFSSTNIATIIETIAEKAKENPSSIIGNDASNLLAYIAKKHSRSTKNNIKHTNEIMKSFIDRVDIKNTKAGIELILRTNTRAEMSFYGYSDVKTSNVSAYFDIPFGSYTWKNNINLTINYGDSDSKENADLLKIWKKLKTKAKLKTEAKKMTQNTFRILN